MSLRDPAHEPGKLTAISHFCLGTMEASWLATVIVIPLLYNPYSLRGFQFNKEEFLRLFALLGFAALVTWVCDKILAKDKDPVSKSWPRFIPLGASVTLLVLAYAISTCLSVNPYLSLWGSDQHLEGTFSLLCDLALFGAVVIGLRTTEQMERLATLILVASIPVSIYALMQKAGLDPNDFSLSDGRSCSLAGNPIYLGAYLAMVIPLTIWRIWSLAGWLRSRTLKPSLELAALVFYGLALLLQLGGFICTSSRGPFVGLSATGLFLFLGATAYWGKKRMLLGGFILIGVMVIGFAVLSLATSYSGHAPKYETLSRFTRILPVNGNDSGRNVFWSHAPKLMLATQPLPYPDGSTDRFHALRPFFGYGPETLMAVLPHLYFWPGTEVILENRFHNVVWDTWSTTGFFGLLALLFFVLLLFYQGYDLLGLQIANWPRYSYWLVVPGFGLAGSIISGLFLEAYIGLGLMVGLLGGLGLYWLLAFLLPRPNSRSCGLPPEKAFLLITLLAALAGHLMEISFAYTTPSTSALFWIYAGVITVLWLCPDPVEVRMKTTPRVNQTEERKAGKSHSPKAPAHGRGLIWLWPALSSGLILVTLLFGFIYTIPHPDQNASMWDVLTVTLTQSRLENNPSYLVLLLLGPTWILSGFAFAADPFLKSKTKFFGHSWGMTLLVAGLIATGYAVLRSAQIAAVGPISDDHASTSSALAQGLGYQMTCGVLVLLVLAFVWTGGWKLSPVSSRFGSNFRLAAIILGTANALALTTIYLVCLNPLRANMMAQWATRLEQQLHARQSVDVLRQAVSLTPGDTEYRRMLSDACMLMTINAPSIDAINSDLTESEKQLLEAKKLTSGLDLSDNELATLYLEWASIESDPDKQVQLARKARAAFDQALVFEPGYEVIWTDRASMDTLYLNDPDDARMSLAKARELQAGISPADWGDFYRDRILKVANPGLKQFYALHALDLYNQQLNNSPDDHHSVALCHLGKCKVYWDLGDPLSALNEGLEAVKISPEIDDWDTESTLAQIYFRTGKREDALRCLQKALTTAPPEQQASLLSLKASLQN